MTQQLLYILFAMILLTACDKSLHEMPANKPVGKSCIVGVTLNNSSVKETPLNDVHTFWFDETDKLFRTDYYSSVETLAMDRIEYTPGNYTIIAIVNVGSSFTPPSSDISLTDFAKWVHTQSKDYENMLSGTLRYTVINGSQVVVVDLEPKSSGVKEVSVELLLEIPSPRLPDFEKVRSTSGLGLRGVVYIYDKNTRSPMSIKRAMLTPTAQEGVYSIGLSLFAGNYDLCVWVDYCKDASTDNHYFTDEALLIRTHNRENYTADTDARDCFAKFIQIQVTEDAKPIDIIKMIRPVAKYRLVATDVAKYEAKKGTITPIEDLQISIVYQGFMPNAYNIRSNAPEGADTGYKYKSLINERSSSQVTLGKDFVFVNGQESLVVLTIKITDKQGKMISTVPGIIVDYRVGHLTTVRGEFLTAGNGSGSGGGQVEVDTEWDDDYNFYI